MGRMIHGEPLLFIHAWPWIRPYPVSVLPADMDGPVNAAGIDNNYFIGPLNTFQAVPDIAFFIKGDDRYRKLFSWHFILPQLRNCHHFALLQHGPEKGIEGRVHAGNWLTDYRHYVDNRSIHRQFSLLQATTKTLAQGGQQYIQLC